MTDKELRLELCSASSTDNFCRAGKAHVNIYLGDELVAQVTAEIDLNTNRYGYDSMPAPRIILKKTQGTFVPTSYL
jgi:hypothetical protein